MLNKSKNNNNGKQFESRIPFVSKVYKRAVWKLQERGKADQCHNPNISNQIQYNGSGVYR